MANILVAHYYSLAVNIALQKLAKISAFPLKLITNLMSRNTARMHRMFLSFRNVFNIDQQVLELVVLSDNFWDNFE